MFSTRRESLAQAYPPTLLGIAFFHIFSQVGILTMTYHVMERAAKACEEPENPETTKNGRYFKFSSLSHPRFLDLQKIGFFKWVWTDQYL